MSLSSPSSSVEALDRLLPPMGAGRSPRKRTTSQCKSEPPLLRTSKRTIYTAGRPPWYNEHGTQSKEAFAIGELAAEATTCASPPVGWVRQDRPPSDARAGVSTDLDASGPSVTCQAWGGW